MLRISGYDLQYRYQLLKGILDRKAQIEANIDSGLWNRYRSREQILAAKQGKVGKFPNTWFLKGGARNTLKVIPTPGSLLKDALQKKLNQEEPLVDGKTKVIELGGDLITKGFGGTQNFGGSGSCYMSQDNNPCLTDSEADCRVSRSVYMIEC